MPIRMTWKKHLIWGVVVVNTMLCTWAKTAWSGLTSGTDPKGDPIERVAVTLGRSACPPTESGYGSPGGEATVKLRLGNQEIIDTARYHQMTGCGSVSLPATLGQPEKADLFIGYDAGWGGADIGVDRSCQQGSVFDETRVAWPRQRMVLWDPNKERTGCGFFVRFQLGNPVSCSGPTTDGYARLAPGATPAYMYHFDWGRLRPEPAENIMLLDKPYLKSPTPDPSQEGNADTIVLTRTNLFVQSGNGLSDCNGWFTGWHGRGDLLLTRLRPDKFTIPGYTPPAGSASQSPPLELRVEDINPWDADLLINNEPYLYEPLNQSYTPALGNNVTEDATDRFLARVSLNPLYEPRRAHYTILGEAFTFPLVVGKLHTIHADLCVLDGDTCQPKPTPAASGSAPATIPVYAIPVPETGEDPWIDLSATWGGTLTLEEQGAQTGNATGVEIPHPKGLLSSLSVDQLQGRLVWRLTQPANRPELLTTDAATIATDPFSRVVPHAKLNVAEPGLYEVELAMTGDDGDRLVVDKTRLISLDLDAHQPGTLAEPGLLVSDDEENDPWNLSAAVNNDDDNADTIADNDPTGSPIIDAEDDEIVTVVVRKFLVNQLPGGATAGSLELSASDGVRFFTTNGTQALTLPLSVDLSNPSGPLAEVVQQDVILRMEADTPQADAVLTLAYKQNDAELVRDVVHLRVTLPLDLDAHWPGTLAAPGIPVAEADENDSLKLIAAVNNDDDNDDNIIDDDRSQSPAIVAEDDDILTFVVRKLLSNPGTGTVELFAGDGLHFFTADGAQELTLL